jgi:hypothetical protein
MTTRSDRFSIRSRILARVGAALAVAGLVLVGSAAVTATSSAAPQSRDAEPFMAQCREA